MKITILVITLNEERNLARCLASVRSVADEIIVLDSYSTDKTVEIAQSFDAKVIQSKFLGYGEQKNMGTSLAKNDWILSLDADELLSPLLITSIEQLNNDCTANGFQFSRMTNYCGQWIRHCGWYPDWQTRLYNRQRGQWIEKKVHEYWSPSNEGKLESLNGDILHYSFTTVNEHLRKIDKYTTLAAAEAVANGKKIGILKLFFGPAWHFFFEYFFRLGFLDGYYGYIICKLSAYSSFLKSAKTRMLYSRLQQDEPVIK